MMMNKKASYRVKAIAENIEKALDPIMDVLESIQIDHKTCYKIRLALDELLTNVVSYAYDNHDGEMEIRYEIFEEDTRYIVIDIIDEGKAFNPLEADDPDVTIDVSERQIGGLGLFIVKNTMDSLSYKRENNQNILTIKKIL